MSAKEQKRLNLGKANIIFMIVALVLLIAGYVIMSFNEISISPVLLMIAYLVILPLALLWPPPKKD